MADETHRREEFSLQISYTEEYVEDERPGSDVLYPVQSPKSFKKVSVSRSNRALWFLVIISVACLGALILAPVPIVQGSTAAIWLGSLKLTQAILNHRERDQ